MKKLTEKQRETRARQAEKLLENKIFNQAMDDVRGAIHANIETLPPSDVEGLMICKGRLHLLASIEQNIRTAIRDGKLDRFRADEDKNAPYLGDIEDIVKWRTRQQAQS